MSIPYLLTLSCPNQPGIVTRITAEMFRHGGDIKEAHQFDDPETGRFFGRIVFTLPDDASAAQFEEASARWRTCWASIGCCARATR